MNYIRKISVGSDYKNAMHYIVGQSILNGDYTIHLIQFDIKTDSIKIWIQKKEEVVLWKEFNTNLPLSLEYNINF